MLIFGHLPQDNDYLLILFIFFLGNLLVIFVVIMHRRMRTITNFFLTNLAVADLCVGLFCVYQNLSLYLTTHWAFGDFLCKMYHFVHSLSYTASIAILIVISVERYVAIVHPMLSKQVCIHILYILLKVQCSDRNSISYTTF